MYIYQSNRSKDGVSGPKPKVDLVRDKKLVEKIRKDYEDGMTVKGLMLDYNLSRATVYRILKALDLT